MSSSSGRDVVPRSTGCAVVAACTGLVLALLGCGEDRPTVTVLAAASLTGAFDDLAERFEELHPGVEVRMAYDSSATLAQQAVEGAPADVLATADQATMRAAAPVAAGEPRVFATNTLVLVTPAGGRPDVTGVDDLDGAAYVACVAEAPCGALARELLVRNKVSARPASLEPDVRGVLARVVADEADAGLVYATDALSAGDAVETYPIPGASRNATSYPIVTLANAEPAHLAEEFVELVLSEDGQQVLARAGFRAAP